MILHKSILFFLLLFFFKSSSSQEVRITVYESETKSELVEIYVIMKGDTLVFPKLNSNTYSIPNEVILDSIRLPLLIKTCSFDYVFPVNLEELARCRRAEFRILKHLKKNKVKYQVNVCDAFNEVGVADVKKKSKRKCR